MTDPAAEAIDPSTPPARLAELMEVHLDAVLANPAWPLVLMSQPDFWSLLTTRSLFTLVRLPRCPVALAEWVAVHVADQRILHRLSGNQALPAPPRRTALLRVPKALRLEEIEYAADLLSAAEMALLKRCLDPATALTMEDAEALAVLGKYGQFTALSHPRCPGAWVERLQDAFLPSSVELAACHPNLSLSRLEALLQSPDVDLRCRAASNPALTPALFEMAAADPITRAEVAAHPSLPASWVDIFLRDPDEHVRQKLAGNEALPESVQRSLALDPALAVRAALLRNPFIARDVRQLAQRTNRQERERVRAQGK